MHTEAPTGVLTCFKSHAREALQPLQLTPFSLEHHECVNEGSKDVMFHAAENL